ncbi:MAG: His/Gly/Thr/Pro-type tRNA ligase C-terminal domain-containing protein, partial [Chlorobiales bacterium]|nr:His/Gly/Thr/Pro-type tRNA ligase C-terminal domain-containing protein [Chlorobiales bacterium]
VTQDPSLAEHAVNVCDALRKSGIRSLMDLAGRSMKAQMREANRMRAAYALFVGESEIQRKVYGLKNLGSSEQESLSIQEVIEKLKPLQYS